MVSAWLMVRLSFLRIIAMPVITLCGFEKSSFVIRSASAASVGLPIIWPCSSAMVSAPRMRLFGCCWAICSALISASCFACSIGQGLL